jgi:hypothetical protein
VSPPGQGEPGPEDVAQALREGRPPSSLLGSGTERAQDGPAPGAPAPDVPAADVPAPDDAAPDAAPDGAAPGTGGS